MSASTPPTWRRPLRSSPGERPFSVSSTLWTFIPRSLNQRSAFRVSAHFFLPKIWMMAATRWRVSTDRSERDRKRDGSTQARTSSFKSTSAAQPSGRSVLQIRAAPVPFLAMRNHVTLGLATAIAIVGTACIPEGALPPPNTPTC